jgi:hypothetical protein
MATNDMDFEAVLEAIGGIAQETPQRGAELATAIATHRLFQPQNEKIGNSVADFINYLANPEAEMARRRRIREAQDELWRGIEDLARNRPPDDFFADEGMRGRTMGGQRPGIKERARSAAKTFWADMVGNRRPQVTPRQRLVGMTRAINPVSLALTMVIEDLILRGAQNEDLMRVIEEGQRRSAEESTQRGGPRRSPTGA